jgi:Skp family chaperone for outer membrane proteins
MKKLLFVCVALTASLLFSKTTNAQAVKIGYFDEESVLGSFPDINRIDTLLAIYSSDSLGVEFNYRLSEFQKADSAFKKDSATLPAKARELALRELYQKRATLANWQQIAEQMRGEKMNQLLMPYRQKIADALKAIVAEGKYTLVLNQSALSPYVQPPLGDNLSIRVALRLKLPISKEVEDAFKAATGGAAAPAARPK